MKSKLAVALLIAVILSCSMEASAADYCRTLSGHGLPAWDLNLGQRLGISSRRGCCKARVHSGEKLPLGLCASVGYHSSYGWVVTIESPRDWEASSDPKLGRTPSVTFTVI